MVTTRRQRGQGTVELAIGLLVFVTILVFGIHFAEIAFLSLKVQESSATAIWDATQAKMHVLPDSWNLLDPSTVAQRANERYKDLDGRSSKTGGGTITYVFTKADSPTVTCEAENSIEHRPPNTTEGVYQANTGGMRCSSKATISVWKFPTSFFDDGSGAFFKEKHYSTTSMTICGVNRGGGCEASFGILLDDFGLALDEESTDCPVLDDSGCKNQAYYQSALRVFNRHGWGNKGAAMQLARTTIGQVPINSSKFWMSFKVYDDSENGGDDDPGTWPTTPGKGSPTNEYDQSVGKRKPCWLGLKCDHKYYE
ncbi:TadE/TadG family type IV pilus assembly protein [Hyalangium versicolor]|uniref:TadE/TadG family type IV pilus assembly protein n=1 Tax=Hyalangium versicolor TaxID=2861190 RepID=UPI001CCE73CF|nr:hypothetical protein [Hyalangium versicolor]